MSSGKPITKLLIKPRKFDPKDATTIKRMCKKALGFNLKAEDIHAIWKEHLRSCKETLLNGEEFSLGLAGHIGVYRSNLSDNPKAIAFMIRRANSGIPLIPCRMNYIHNIVYVRSEKADKRIKFVANRTIQMELNKILKTTKKEYKPRPLNVN